MSSPNVDIPDTNISYSKYMFLIDETYKYMNHMHLVHFHLFYMNIINIFLCCYKDQLNLENIQHQYLPFIVVYLPPNDDSLFIYRFFL